MRHRSRIRRFAVVGLCSALAWGPWGVADADDGLVPDSCKPHPTHVVNPGCVPAVVEDAQSYSRTYPDLVPDVTQVYVGWDFTFDPETGTFTQTNPKIHFDTWSKNLGPVPLDLVSDDLTAQESASVSQCLAWRPDYVCRERQTVGGFVAHPEHGHIHFEGFASYELRRLLADGTPDYSTAGLVDTSDKVSFCLIDLEQVRADAVPVPTYLFCDGKREGISPGWADIYGAFLEGQQFPVAGMADGSYALVITMNPMGNVFESDHTNNRVAATIELSGGGTMARLLSKSWS
jgi:hypothetical protein